MDPISIIQEIKRHLHNHFFTFRKFHAMFGVSFATFSFLFSLLADVSSEFQVVHLCYALYFLKCYPGVEEASLMWGVSEKTFQHHCWLVLKMLYLLLANQV
jgi:hypothetical protein